MLLMRLHMEETRFAAGCGSEHDALDSRPGMNQ